EFEQDVAALNATMLCRAVRSHVTHNDAAGFLFPERLGHTGRYVLRQDAEIGADDLAVLQNLVHYLAREIGRHGKPDTLAAAGAVRNDGRVDADQFAAIIDEGAAGIPRIDRGIGLQKIFVVFNAKSAAALGADDSLGHGLADAKRIANGNRHVANFHFGRVADG